MRLVGYSELTRIARGVLSEADQGVRLAIRRGDSAAPRDSEAGEARRRGDKPATGKVNGGTKGHPDILPGRGQEAEEAVQ